MPRTHDGSMFRWMENLSRDWQWGQNKIFCDYFVPSLVYGEGLFKCQHKNASRLWIWWYFCATRLYRKTWIVCNPKMVWLFSNSLFMERVQILWMTIATWQKYCNWMLQISFVHNSCSISANVFKRTHSNWHWKVVGDRCHTRNSKDVHELALHVL